MEEIKEETTSVSVTGVPLKVVIFLKEQNFKIAGICRDALIEKYNKLKKTNGGKK